MLIKFEVENMVDTPYYNIKDIKKYDAMIGGYLLSSRLKVYSAFESKILITIATGGWKHQTILNQSNFRGLFALEIAVANIVLMIQCLSEIF